MSTTLTTEARTNLRDMIDELNIEGPVVVMGWANDGTKNSLIFAKGNRDDLVKLGEDAMRNFKS